MTLAFDHIAPASRPFIPASWNFDSAEKLVALDEARPQNRYENLDMKLETGTRTLWAFMKPQARPSFTTDLLRDMRSMQDYIKSACTPGDGKTKPFDHFVFGSHIPGIYNLGGDLRHFAERIRERDRDSMRHYAHSCAEIIYRNAHSFDVPVITIALVQGDALGGGFECALSYDVIVAERSAKLGLPEILFNLFPGMGAYSFLSRRIGPANAEKMILSGRVYTAEDLHKMGVVDVLAEDGEGEAAVAQYIKQTSPKHNARQALYQTRRRVNPVTREELFDVVDIWVEAALRLTEKDLRLMGRLASAQDRRIAGIGQESPSCMAAE